jgi:hypothetical protein
MGVERLIIMNNEFDLEKSFKEFIKDKNVVGYDTCINSFKNFLTSKNMMNTDTAKIYFQGIRSDELIKGLGYCTFLYNEVNW